MLEEVGLYLGCGSLPPVYIVHRRDFNPETIEDEDEEEKTTKYVLIRCNLLTTKPADTKFHSRILASVLDAHQWGRLDSDARGWVLTGFSAWWPVRELVKTPADLIKLVDPEGKSSGRALSRGDLENWLRTRAKMTTAEQSACAGLGMIALADYGEEPRRRFLAAVLGYSAPMDARATLHDWLHPVGRTLKSTTGGDLAALASKWTAAMQTGETEQ